MLTVFGNHVDFANPFITNYEQRDENTYGLRTYFQFSGKQTANFDGKLNVGLEWQQTNSLISNYDNNKGVKGNVQKIDKINTNQHFFFARYAADIYKRLHAEAALSLNYYHYKFRNRAPLNEADFTNRDFSPQLMPRFALSYQVTNDFIWRASVSRGYSTPTTAEGPLRDAVDACQRLAITQALARHQGNWAQAARALEVDASNLHKLARRLCIK